jgi:signal transduction histidine kinase
MYVPGLLSISQYGLNAGSFLAAACAIVLAAIYFNRGTALVLLALMLLISLLSGWVASRGWSTLRLVDADPLLFRNWIRVTISVGLLTAFLTLAVHYLVSHLERHYLSAIRAMAQIRYLNRRLESAKEEEKQFLARELHDEFGQTLTALKLRFQMIGRSAIAPDVGSQVQESVKLVDGLIDRVRRISIDLRPPLLDEVGVVPALRAFLDAQSGHSGVKMALMMDGIEGRLAPETEMVCYRIVQEAVTNVLRHASAHTITVSIERSDRAIAIDVRDDGRGFEPSETLDRADGNGHLGVVGMRERAQSLGGTFNLSSRRGSGTSVSATLPV